MDINIEQSRTQSGLVCFCNIELYARKCSCYRVVTDIGRICVAVTEHHKMIAGCYGTVESIKTLCERNISLIFTCVCICCYRRTCKTAFGNARRACAVNTAYPHKTARSAVPVVTELCPARRQIGDLIIIHKTGSIYGYFHRTEITVGIRIIIRLSVGLRL